MTWVDLELLREPVRKTYHSIVPSCSRSLRFLGTTLSRIARFRATCTPDRP